ncbi:TIR domain-containing protein [Butyrivibrio sp. CB08]|uniref:TIR domain-containing protein n=1 Tax=Butyrivibrio sp. CB08 TaxID=2364879 RepID=UPI000EA94B51|nr:TIR domain-containing protein [Butyrivibrio sp. CB08]RKM61089.1 TIR domain-containing protein [Butyrivibrio sp. CB08]
MINHFNAFISYKHADLDNKIAASIVRDLEHYHIPRKIQKSTGVKKIDRIFRDKDELPITSDLNDTISQALYNADYLIVICSTNTKKSTWVEREIEVFLKNHTMNQILTVLADGEPYEVIPKILLTGKKEVVDEDGVTRTVEMPFEPLSCDYRLPYRRAKAEELPRMAAALIGCSYDELINRHRQYKMRRMTAIASGVMALSLGFAGYMFYSNTLIHKNYLESLKNQSRNLANQAEKVLEDENRLEAMQLSLFALPDGEGDERPVTPEAIRAVTKSSMAYTSLEGGNIDIVWNYRMPNHVNDMKLTSDAKYFGARDTSGVIIVWDAKTHKQVVYYDDYQQESEDFTFIGNDKLIIRCEKSARAFDLTSGEMLWTLTDKDGEYNFIYASDVFDYGNDSILIAGSQGHIDIVSMKDGSITKSFDILTKEETDSYYINHFAMSDDRKKLAFCEATRYSISDDNYRVGEYDFESGEKTFSDTYEGWSRQLLYIGDKILMDIPPFESGTSSSRLYDYDFVTEGHTLVRCLSSGTLTQDWESELVTYDVSIESKFLPLENGNVAYSTGDTCKVWNPQTGEELGNYRLNDSIIDISDLDKDGEPLFITQGGATGSPSMNGDTPGVSLISRFADNLSGAVVGNGVYAQKYLSRDIVYYASGVYDEDWTQIEGIPEYNISGIEHFLSGNTLCVLTEVDEGCRVFFVDTKEKSYLGDVIIKDGIKPSRYKILGVYAGTLYLASCQDNRFEITEVEIESKKIDKLLINDDTWDYDPKCAMADGKLVYIDTQHGKENKAEEIDLATGEKKTVVIPDWGRDLFFVPESNDVYVLAETDYLVHMDNETYSEVKLPEEWEKTKYVAGDGQALAISNAEVIKLFDADQNLISEISCGNVEPLGMVITKIGGQRLLLVAYQDGTLFRYNAENGEFVGKADLSVSYMAYLFDSSIEADDENGFLYVQVGDLIDIIETDTWIETTRVMNCFGHDKETDTFLTYSYENNKKEGRIGYFEHYSVERLIQKTKDYLQGEEMSEDQKSMYGITD